jgi:hypothetical protein
MTLRKTKNKHVFYVELFENFSFQTSTRIRFETIKFFQKLGGLAFPLFNTINLQAKNTAAIFI